MAEDTTTDGFDVTILRVERTEDTRIEVNQDLLGRGVEFPSGTIVMEWNRDAYPEADRLDHPHQSVYGSRADLEQGTGGKIVVEDEEVPVEESPTDPVEEEPTEPVEDNRHEFTGEAFAISSNPRTPAMTYRFQVEGEVPDASSLEEKDTITEQDDGTFQVEGTVGPKGSDTYYLKGKIANWETEDQDGNSVPETGFDTLVEGEQVELWRILGKEKPEYDDTSAAAIGGGEYYSQTITEEDADILVVDDPDAQALREALDQASSGDVVFVDGGAEIYSPSESERFHVPNGVTLASNRGVDGSDGALLHTDASYGWGGEGLVTAEQRARVTGIRVRGPHPDVRWREHSGDYEMAGIRCRGSDVEIDNCEVFGWAMCTRAKNNAHIHHCHIHHANMQGLGYGVHAGSSEGAVIEYNHFEHWRHVVAGSGGGGYEARFNLIDGPCISHAFDQHSPGGTYTDIHHNTSTVMEHDAKSKQPVFACFRGEDVDKAEVYKNWVQGNLLEPNEGATGWRDEFIVQAQASSWGDITYWDNHLGQTEPTDPDVGCPRSSSPEDGDSGPSLSGPDWFEQVAGFYADTPDRLTEGDCDVTVVSRDELLSEVRTQDNAIWVDSDIDLTGVEDHPIADGVTIAGNRQPVESRDGPILHVDDHSTRYTFKARGDNVRITGLRIRGPEQEVVEYDPNKNQTFGLFIGDGCKFDNLEVYGWPFAGFCSGAKSYPVSHEYAYIHFHDCIMKGLGYGAELFNGHHVFHHCYFDRTRHPIAGFGRATNGYEAYHCVCGPNHLSHGFDMHALQQNVSSEESWVAGGTVDIHDCHFELTHAISGYPQEAIKVRGIPDDVCEIHANTFRHEEEPSPPGSNGDAYYQTNMGGDEWVNFDPHDNEFGSDLEYPVPKRYR